MRFRAVKVKTIWISATRKLIFKSTKDVALCHIRAVMTMHCPNNCNGWYFLTPFKIFILCTYSKSQQSHTVEK